MTRRDYALIASAVKSARLPYTHRQTIALALAAALAGDSERFDIARFLTACGVRA